MPTARRALKRRTRLKRVEVVGLLPDIHIPKEDPDAVKWALQELKEQRLTKLILLGDVVSLDSVSRFSKTIAVRASLPEEIKGATAFIKHIEKQFPKIPKVYLQGNHENRLTNYLLRKAPELGQLPGLLFRNLLQIPDHWEVLDYGDFVKVGDVLVQHGRSWGQTAARRNLLLGCSVVQGHSHRFKMLTHRCAGSGKVLTSCELGCLCSFDQGYSKLTDWSHACGWIKDGNIVTTVRGG